jgi:hypothetical protein
MVARVMDGRISLEAHKIYVTIHNFGDRRRFHLNPNLDKCLSSSQNLRIVPPEASDYGHRWLAQDVRNLRANSAAAKLVPVMTVMITVGSYCLMIIRTASPNTTMTTVNVVTPLNDCLGKELMSR